MSEPLPPEEPGPELPVMGTMSVVGVSDATGVITIDTGDMAEASGRRRSSIIMLTYDSTTRIEVTSGTYALLQTIPRNTPWGPQTAAILVFEGKTEQMITIKFGTMPTIPVHWRATGVTYGGRFRSYPWLRWETGQIDLDVTEKYEIGALFVSGAYPAVPVATPHAGIVPASQVTDDTVSVTQQIVGLWWQTDRVTPLVSGPHFVSGAEIGWRPPVIIEAPACCDCADVFLIKNPRLALGWDLEGSSALIDQSTLLLNHTDEDGTKWVLKEMDGWWTLPPPSLPALERSGYLDGNFPVDGRYEARAINIDGTFQPREGVGVMRAREKIILSANAVRDGALLVVKEQYFPKQSYVWLADQPKIDTVNAAGLTEFSITLRAVDPIKYHAGVGGLSVRELPIDIVLDGRVYQPTSQLRFDPVPTRRYQDDDVENTIFPVVNVGNTAVAPRIYMYGPMTGGTIHNLTTGQKMVYQGSISPGDVLITDCYWRTVVLRTSALVDPGDMQQPYEIPGENRRWMLTLTSPWITLVPGVNELRVTSAVEGSRTVIAFRSGWIGS